MRSRQDMVSGEVFCWDFRCVTSIGLSWKCTDVVIDIIGKVHKVVLNGEFVLVMLAHKVVDLDVHFVVMMLMVVLVLVKVCVGDHFLCLLVVVLFMMVLLLLLGVMSFMSC